MNKIKLLFTLLIIAMVAVGYGQTPTTISAKKINAIENIFLRGDKIDTFSTDPLLSANADNVMSTQKALKAYIDGKRYVDTAYTTNDSTIIVVIHGNNYTLTIRGGANGGGGGSGTVVSVSSPTGLSPLFTTTVSNPSSNATLNFLLTNAAAGRIFGNPTGSTGAPSYFGVDGTLRFVSNLLGVDTVTDIPSKYQLDTAKTNLRNSVSTNIPPNVGAAFRVYAPQTPGFKSIRGITNGGILLDTATSGEIGVKVDSSVYVTKTFLNNFSIRSPQMSPGVVMDRPTIAGDSLLRYGFVSSITIGVGVNTDSSRFFQNLINFTGHLNLSTATATVTNDTVNVPKYIFSHNAAGRPGFYPFLTIAQYASGSQDGIITAAQFNKYEFQQYLLNSPISLRRPIADTLSQGSPTNDTFYVKAYLDTSLNNALTITNTGTNNWNTVHNFAFTFTQRSIDTSTYKVLVTDGSNNIFKMFWPSTGGGGGGNLNGFLAARDTITKTSHGFTVGKVVYFNGTTWALADTTNADDFPVSGVVSKVVDANNFEVTHAGKMTWTSTPLTLGVPYYLTVSGNVTSTAPNTSIPIMYAIDANTVVVQILRGARASGGAGSPPFADNTAIIKNNADNTKLLILSAASIATGTTRTWTFPNVNGTVARNDAAQSFTGVQTLLSAPIITTTSINNQVLTASGTGGQSIWALPLTRSMASYYTSVNGTVDAETDLYSLTIPASTLTADGDYVTFSYIGSATNAATGTRGVEILFDGASKTLLNLPTAQTWKIVGRIIRTSTTAYRYEATCNAGATVSQFYQTGTVTNWTTNLILKSVGQSGSGGGSASDLTATMGSVEYHKIP